MAAVLDSNRLICLQQQDDGGESFTPPSFVPKFWVHLFEHRVLGSDDMLLKTYILKYELKTFLDDVMFPSSELIPIMHAQAMMALIKILYLVSMILSLLVLNGKIHDDEVAAYVAFSFALFCCIVVIPFSVSFSNLKRSIRNTFWIPRFFGIILFAFVVFDVLMWSVPQCLAFSVIPLGLFLTLLSDSYFGNVSLEIPSTFATISFIGTLVITIMLQMHLFSSSTQNTGNVIRTIRIYSPIGKSS